MKKIICQWKEPRNILIFLSVFLLALIIIFSILREKIVSENNEITTVVGRGEISYQPDIAVINLGVQVDKIFKAEGALNKLNETMNEIVAAAERMGIPKEDIQTQSYSLYPHYDYQGEGSSVSTPSGYDANQQVAIKIRGIDKDSALVGKIIEETGKAGANQVVGISFDVSNLEELKQKARLEAIADARSKSGGLAKAAGVGKLGKVVSWYESVIKSPDSQNSYYGLGSGSDKPVAATPAQVPSGTEEIIIEIGLNYRIK